MYSSTTLNPKDRLKTLLARASHVRCSKADGTPIDMTQRIKADLLALDDPASRDASVKLANDAKHDPEKARTLNALRIEKWNNFVLADTNRLAFFAEVVELAEDDKPAYANQTRNQVSISALPVGAGPKRVDVIPSQGFTLVPLKQIASDEMTFILRDLYNGNDISGLAEETLVLSADMACKLEQEIDTFLTSTVAAGGAFGAFTFTGNKYSRVYVAHSFAQTGNFPTTNDITLPGANTASKFDPDTIKAIIRYCASWGKAFMGGELRPTGRLLVPAKDCADFLDMLTWTGAKQNVTAEQIAETGWYKIGIAGQDYTIVPDNSLDPASGVCYPEMNIKPIRFFTKPSMDEDISTSPQDYELRKKNLKKRFLSKVIGAALNQNMRHTMLRVTYRKAK